MHTSEKKGIAVVTGASTGIGALYADRLAQRGHDLILVARNHARLEDTAAGIRQRHPRAVRLIVADLSEPGDLARVAAELRADPDIGMLVNNAGTGATTPLLDANVEAMSIMIAVNVEAPMRLTHAVVPGFVARGNGTVINVASITAVAPNLLNGVYGGSKAFLLAFSQSLHHELHGKGVRVQVVLPGPTATGFWDKAGLPIKHLPRQWVMPGETMVDAALAGLELGELVTIPSLPDMADWNSFEAARLALRANLSHATAAPRYAPVATGIRPAQP